MPTGPLQVLQQEGLDLQAERLEIINAAGPKGFSPEQRQRLDAITARLARLDADVARLEAEREARRREPIPAEAGGGGFTGDMTAISLDYRDSSRPARGPRYADLFGAPPRAAGWKSREEFFSVVHGGLNDPRLMAATMSEKVGSEGGFLVPDEYAAVLLDTSLEDEIVRPRATIYPMASKTKKIPGWDTSSRAGGAFAGLTPVWLEESGTATDQKGKTFLLELNASKLGIFANTSNELVADGMTFEEQLGVAMQAAVGFGLDTAFLTGNGVAKPKGVLIDDALITISKETGQVADTIVIENIDKMFARLYPAGLSRSIWLANPTTIPQLLSLVRVVGTGGASVPVLGESNGKFTMLTRPVIFTEKVPKLGDKGDLILTDLSQYAVGLRKEMSLDKSTGPGWHEDETSYRVISRVDGRGTWTAPVTPLNGDTLSWCVTLAARA